MLDICLQYRYRAAAEGIYTLCVGARRWISVCSILTVLLQKRYVLRRYELKILDFLGGVQ